MPPMGAHSATRQTVMPAVMPALINKNLIYLFVFNVEFVTQRLGECFFTIMSVKRPRV